jgi:alkanesulfonate monooxygenase SsuD/methylene tetrahydromethanopterin reductase-like flavin-dependent oxidoreductase (luciferase family)
MASNLQSALWFPLFDELADPRVFVALAEEAETAGWDGVFVWDHIAWTAPVQSVADPWISLAAAANATETIRLGTMVTPVPRRRPVKLARETASLDRLSGGRLILGVGLGSDAYAAEFSRTGEEVTDRVRAEMLDEALEVIGECWSGQPVRHRGRHYTVHDVAFLPTPVQQPRIPIWVAGRVGRAKPMNRAIGVDGFFPLALQGPNQLAEIAATITRLRPDPTARYDIAVEITPGEDPAGYAAAGATWGMTQFDPETMTLDLVRGVLRDGPVRPALRSEGGS